jgi:hypothetical protein
LDPQQEPVPRLDVCSPMPYSNAKNWQPGIGPLARWLRGVAPWDICLYSSHEIHRSRSVLSQHVTCSSSYIHFRTVCNSSTMVSKVEAINTMCATTVGRRSPLLFRPAWNIYGDRSGVGIAPPMRTKVLSISLLESYVTPISIGECRSIGPLVVLIFIRGADVLFNVWK